MEIKSKSDYLPKEYCNLDFKKVITQWDEAIPLGNGETGCLVWGNSNGLRFSLDRTDIWDKTPSPVVLDKDYKYKNLIKYVKSGDRDSINEKYNYSYRNITPTKLPAGKIIFNFGESEGVHSYLNLANAVSKITIIKKDENIEIETYLHATEKVGIVRISKPMTEFDFVLENTKFGKKSDDKIKIKMTNSVKGISLDMLKYDEPYIVNEKNRKYFIQKIDDEFSYGIFLYAFENEGETIIAYRVSTSEDSENWVENALELTERFAGCEKSKAFADHEKWWDKYWSKSAVSLPDKFFEKNWYLTNYLFASCSRKGSYPMALQGVWTADNGSVPPWHGDYHSDLNTQLSYTHYMKANHLEEGESFLDFLWDSIPKARKFAREFYETNGICYPAVMSIDGTALGGWPMYALSPINQLWLCQMFERHYRATGDINFLKEKVYPFVSESAQCLYELMHEENGKLYFEVSSSPEIHDDTLKSWLTPNSNYDLSLMRYVITQLVDFSEILNNGEKEKWQKILDKLPGLAVNKDNVLMLSPDESLKETHRHHSHAMAIHPLRLIEYRGEENKKIIDATVHNLEVLGTGMWVGFSFTWMSEFYSVQENGNGAAYQLEVFWRNFCSQNGFHLNGDYKKRGTSQFHYRPFTLEANMCAADALQEMLMYSEKGTIKFFPAIPDEWKEKTVSFNDFLAGNGLLVSAQITEGKIKGVKFSPSKSCTVKIEKWNELSHLKLIGAEINIKDNTAEITFEAGKTAILA